MLNMSKRQTKRKVKCNGVANVKTKVALLPLPYPALSTEKPYTTITLLITYNCEKEKQSTLLVRYFLAIF